MAVVAKRPEFFQGEREADLGGRLGAVVLEIYQDGENVDMEKLNTTIKSLRESIRHLYDENEQLRHEVASLKEKVEELEKIRSSLVIGQIALKVERIFIDYILQDCKIRNRKYMHLTIDQIDRAILDKDSLESGGIFTTDDELQGARKKWKELNDKHHLTAEHYGAIRSLKSARNVKAHPDIKLETAHKLIKDCCEDKDDRDIMLELLGISKNL